VSRSVRDSALMLDCTAGSEPGDPYTAPTPECSFVEALGRPPRKLRIAMALGDHRGGKLHPECAKAVTAAGKWIALGFLHNGLLIPAFCLLIYGLACNGWPAPILSGRVMQLLGDASYSIYVLQLCVWWSSLAVVTRFARMDYTVSVYTDIMMDSWWFFLVNSAILIALSILLFKYVETPSRIYLRSRLSWPRPDASSYAPDQLRSADAATS